MRLIKKSLSRVSLVDLLRRRRSNLDKFVKDNGIVTYDLLVSRCNSMGVVAPTAEEFSALMGNSQIHQVSSPTEGVVVLEPPALISDYSGKTLQDVTVVNDANDNVASHDDLAQGPDVDDVTDSNYDFKKKKKRS